MTTPVAPKKFTWSWPCPFCKHLWANHRIPKRDRVECTRCQGGVCVRPAI